jgi:transmembrane sensor
MKWHDNLTEELITRYLAGEALPEEAMALHEWINESDQNRKRFDEFRKAWQLGEGENNKKSNEKEFVWTNIKRLTSESFLRKKNTSPALTVFRIAALIIITVGVGWFLYSTQKEEQPYSPPIVFRSETSTLERTLPDNSHVILNRFSRLTFNNDFGQYSRQVSLSGECYFDITHQENKDFVVSIGDLQIKVLGTIFNVRYDSLSNTIKTSVSKGLVMMYNQSDSLLVEAGRAGTYHHLNQTFTLAPHFDSNNLSYATKTMVFNDASLIEITSILEATYGVTFRFDDPKLKECRMSSTFHEDSLDFILDVVSTTLNIEYEIKGKVVTISGNGCF